MININEYIRRAEKQDIVLTKFLDTSESSTLRAMKNDFFRVFFFGGYEDAERVRSIILKKDLGFPLSDEYEISVLKVIPKSTHRLITHRHVLGTILSFGVKRETIGDILINEKEIYIFIDKTLENYLTCNLTSINNVLVDVSVNPLETIKLDLTGKEELVNVASLRLDGIIAHTLRVGRNKANEIIESGNVQVNHLDCLSSSHQLKINDLISIRHFGRIKILEIVNTTKKERLVVKVEIKH